jgi:hypothetical protein
MKLPYWYTLVQKKVQHKVIIALKKGAMCHITIGFHQKVPQISPYSKQDGLCKIHESFTTSNRKILYLTCMLACPPNLTYSFLTVCEIITFKVDRKVFSTVPEGYNRVLEAKKTIFGGIFGIFLFKLLFIGDLGTCPKTFIRTRGVEL